MGFRFLVFFFSFYVLHHVRYRELHSSTAILFGLQRPVEGKSLCEKEMTTMGSDMHKSVTCEQFFLKMVVPLTDKLEQHHTT